MANTTTNIVSGLSNPFPMSCVANQQINAGDALIQNNDATAGFVALPVACLSGNNYQSTSNQAANNVAIESLQQAVHNNFAGMSVGYRSAKNTSYGKASDRVGVAVGRVKLAVDNNLNNSEFNSAAAQPIGTPWGVSVAATNPAANNANASVNPNLYVVCGNGQNFTGAQFSIGRQALPKAVNDPFVWVDVISTIISGGAQETATA